MNDQTILIVDDEKNLLVALENLLITEGYSVVTASRGRDAVVLAKSRQPDLIVLDVMLPDMDGPQVAEELNGIPETKDIPIIFLTALLSKNEEKTKQSPGTTLVLAKPYEAENLISEIKKLLPFQGQAFHSRPELHQSRPSLNCILKLH